NVDRQELLVTIVRAMGEVETGLQLMFTKEMLGTGLINLLPLHAIGVPILPVEEAAFRGFDQQAVRISAIGKQVGVELLISHLRAHQTTRSCDVTVLGRNLIAALMQVWSRRLRGESVEPEIIEFFREYRDR